MRQVESAVGTEGNAIGEGNPGELLPEVTLKLCMWQGDYA